MRTGVDYIGVGCIFACHDGQGRLLMARRSERARDEQGRWDIGGGQVQFGERLEETIRREVQEEYGATPRSIELIHAFSALRDLGGRPTHWVALLHAVLVDPAEVRLGEPEKFTDIGWFRFDALPEPLHSQFFQARPALERYFSKQLVTV